MRKKKRKKNQSQTYKKGKKIKNLSMENKKNNEKRKL